MWMNVVKNSVAYVATVMTLLMFSGNLSVDWNTHWPFLVSGVIGLTIADYCLLSAYRWMGPGRTLILFGFQPLLTGVASYYIWGDVIYGLQFVSIFFFVLCLFLFSYERFKDSGRWEVQGLLFAFCGVFLDAIGVLLTKYGFETHPEVTGTQANYLRISASLLSFLVMSPFLKVQLLKGWQRLFPKEKSLVIVASLSGTFLSLVFYMQAIKLGKLATVTAIILTDPMIATVLECVWLRRPPSRWLVWAMVSFGCAMFCLFFNQFWL